VQEHLACFLPGTLALGVIHGMPQGHLDMARQLMKTCYEMYHAMPTGLSPEVAVFNMRPDGKRDIDTQVCGGPVVLTYTGCVIKNVSLYFCPYLS